MDNNSNNNISGFSNVSDIKFDDTPAESFENLYGNSSQQHVSNVAFNSGPGMVQNQGIVQPNVAPNSVNPGMVQPNVAPNPVNPGIVQSNVAPNPVNQVIVQPNVAPNSVNPGMVQPNVAPNPVNPGMVQPNVAPNSINPGMVQSNVSPNPINPGMVQPNVVPNPINPGIVQPNIVSNSGATIQSSAVDLSNIDIDAEKMQSIEEQLSKTSQYNPEDIQNEMLSISAENHSDKSKSGLTFLIVLSIILGLAIVITPQIIKLIK